MPSRKQRTPSCGVFLVKRTNQPLTRRSRPLDVDQRVFWAFIQTGDIYAMLRLARKKTAWVLMLLVTVIKASQSSATFYRFDCHLSPIISGDARKKGKMRRQRVSAGSSRQRGHHRRLPPWSNAEYKRCSRRWDSSERHLFARPKREKSSPSSGRKTLTMAQVIQQTTTTTKVAGQTILQEGKSSFVTKGCRYPCAAWDKRVSEKIRHDKFYFFIYLFFFLQSLGCSK